MTEAELFIYAAWIYRVRREQRLNEKLFVHKWQKLARKCAEGRDAE